MINKKENSGSGKNSAEVAIIIRTTDRSIFLKRALEGINKQTYQDFSLVIVHPAQSVETIKEVIKETDVSFREKIQLLPTPELLNKPAALNAGVKATDSAFVAVHDDDDTWEPDFLQETVNYLQSEKDNGIRGVRTYVNVVYEKKEGAVFDEICREEWWGNYGAITLGNMARVNRVVPISFLYDRAMHEEAGLYREELPLLEDWDFYLRFLNKTAIGTIHKRLANYFLRLGGDKKDQNTIFEKQKECMFFDQVIRNYYFRDYREYPELGLILQLARPVACKISKNDISKDMRVFF